MGMIISSKKKGKKIISEFLSDYDEFLQLKGHLDDIRLFSENVGGVQTNISQRGKNEATKYFLITKQYRRGFKFNNSVSCQKLDFDDKAIFVYIVDKTKINPSKREQSIKKIEEKYTQIEKTSHLPYGSL